MAFLHCLTSPFAPSALLGSRHKNRTPVVKKVIHLYSRQQSVTSSASTPHPTPQIDNLVNWCNRVGIRLNKIVPLETNSIRGLFATCDIHPGDELLSIPRRSALIANIQSDTVPPLRFLTGLSPQYWAKASWEIRLAIRLLDESADPHSPFLPYIDILPQNPNSALFAYETLGRAPVAEQLRPYDLHNTADITRAQTKSRYNALRRVLPDDCRDLVTLRNFCWAVSIAVSRGFGIPASGEAESHLQSHDENGEVRPPVEYALFPALDMANCSVHCKTRFVHDRENDVFRVFTGASFTRGEQVYVSYGSKPNDEFVFFYGFVQGSNPANTVKIPGFRTWVLDLAHGAHVTVEAWDRKLQLLVKEKLTHPDKSFELYSDRIDEDLLFVLRVSLASSEELDILAEELSKGKPNKKRTLSLENELAVWRAIEEKCKFLQRNLGDFDINERQRLKRLFSKRPCTASWVWGDSTSDGELLYRYERQMVLSATIERVRHFTSVSTSVGRICTVLIPPSQSRIRTDGFGKMSIDHSTSGVYTYDISAEEIQAHLD